MLELVFVLILLDCMLDLTFMLYYGIFLSEKGVSPPSISDVLLREFLYSLSVGEILLFLLFKEKALLNRFILKNH